MRREIKSLKAPKPVGPYSQAIAAGGFLFISGQIPLDPESGEIIREPFSRAVEIVMVNIGEILKAAGASYDDIVRVVVYLRDLSKFNEFNEIYKKFFREPYPSRTVVEVRNLPRDSPIEIEAIAFLG
ncbi:MAG: Rid family detoxifying hydrolase [Sulfolobales archaeon]